MKKTVIVLLAALSFAAAASAQLNNYNFRISNIVGSDPIVRNYGLTNSIICYCSTNNTCSFTNVSESSTTVPEFVIDVDTVYDMERYGNMVYFCGMKTYGQMPQAIMGYFNASAFSTDSAVYVLNMPWLRRLKKLEVSYFLNNFHVIMVGDENTGNSAIVDAIDKTTYWDVNYSYLAPDYGRFEDVTVVDSFVVATSVTNFFSSKIGRIWYFGKATMSGGIMFQQYAQYREFPRGASSPALIKSGSNPNDFVVVTLPSDVISFGGAILDIHAYTGSSYTISTVLNTGARQVQLKDIGYDYLPNVLEVLVYDNVESGGVYTWKSEVYNTYPYSTVSPKTIYAHTTGVYLTSLGRHLNNGFMTCGMNGSDLYLFRYQLNSWVCMSKKTSQETKFSTNKTTSSLYFNRMNIWEVPQVFIKAFKEEQKTVTCD